MIRTPPASPLFPYTTLFRSAVRQVELVDADVREEGAVRPGAASPRTTRARLGLDSAARATSSVAQANDLGSGRSEEHTSELQSRRDLVCRLLLEKKKKDQTP